MRGWSKAGNKSETGAITAVDVSIEQPWPGIAAGLKTRPGDASQPIRRSG